MDTLTTQPLAFCPIGTAEHPEALYQVTQGVSAGKALGHASDLIAEANTLIYEAAMGMPLDGAKAWLVYRALQNAKAVVDSLAA